ncbi:MAG: glucose 1-dehydrogenase [Acidobacteria bacterium]|nr:glucose 1-dehydrogenase [Acidobacteriota bacterium]
MGPKLEGTVAVVTGGDQGIGRGIAIRLAQDGCDVAICYRKNAQGAQEVVSQIQHIGRKANATQADVSKVGDGQRFVSEAIAAFGKIDVVVNNAGVEMHADFWDVTEQNYDTVVDVNLKGVFFVSQAAVRYWRENKRPGKIINISSVHEELPFPHFAAYCAAKGGLKMLTRNLAVELGPLGITINSIAPGAIETPINAKLLQDPVKLKALLQNIPLGRLGKPEDVAALASFLASSDADYITGSSFFVDGGLTWNYQEQ